MSTIILELGQYVPLPKFCAIWGKMSWGKMSLGHFVLGHFVSGAKCPWGKMSPSLDPTSSGKCLNFPHFQPFPNAQYKAKNEPIDPEQGSNDIPFYIST